MWSTRPVWEARPCADQNDAAAQRALNVTPDPAPTTNSCPRASRRVSPPSPRPSPPPRGRAIETCNRPSAEPGGMRLRVARASRLVPVCRAAALAKPCRHPRSRRQCRSRPSRFARRGRRPWVRLRRSRPLVRQRAAGPREPSSRHTTPGGPAGGGSHGWPPTTGPDQRSTRERASQLGHCCARHRQAAHGPATPSAPARSTTPGWAPRPAGPRRGAGAGARCRWSDRLRCRRRASSTCSRSSSPGRASASAADTPPTIAVADEPSPRECGTELIADREIPTGAATPSTCQACRILRITRCRPSLGTCELPSPTTDSAASSPSVRRTS